METLKLQKLASIPSEDNFESSTSKHFIVEDGGELKRLSADSVVSEPFVVTFSGTTENDDAACDKTFNEIKEAYDSGIKMQAKYDDGNSLLFGDLKSIEYSGANRSFIFVCGYSIVGDNATEIALCTINSTAVMVIFVTV